MQVDFLRYIVLVPLIGAIINGLIGHKIKKPFVSIVACGSVFVSCGLSFYALYVLLSSGVSYLFDPMFVWITTEILNVNISFYIDPLSSVMTLVVTFVGLLIHIYSVGYMSHDKSFARYFSHLNLFIFAMLLLVTSDNLLGLFVGWEGVGLCSYLLIGFWYEDPEKAAAGKKAFLVNRIGDFGFLLGIFCIIFLYGFKSESPIFSLNYQTLAEFTPYVKDLMLFGLPALSVISLLLFIGAIGKSAQIPLYVWLPDAMAGPTPVSALIHAATMVTAGVFMIARMNFIYVHAPYVLLFISVIGLLTALYAATIAIMQNDIKKVLAYSTISQLGYMFSACGVYAFTSGIFHLMTHAFFKALLFLGAGSVIHALSNEQDIRKMGGLRNKMPFTYWTFLIATLAIAGFPLFSGFFSKDEILWNLFSSHYKILWVLGFVTALLTAFYMIRLFALTFLGEYRGKKHVYDNAHESPKSMVIPLVILAFFSLVAGLFGVPHLSVIEGFLHPVWEQTAHHSGTMSLEVTMSMLSGFAAVVMLIIGYYIYTKRRDIPKAYAERFKYFYKIILNKYFVDEIYHKIIVRPLIKCAEICANIFDLLIIDGAFNGVASVSRFVAGKVRRLQTGIIHSYALGIMIGLMIILIWLVLEVI